MNDPRLAGEIDRRVTADELREQLTRPIDGDERAEVLALVDWFMRRYQTAEARLTYVRRAYTRWRRS